jgi:hypothetical protein
MRLYLTRVTTHIKSAKQQQHIDVQDDEKWDIHYLSSR